MLRQFSRGAPAGLRVLVTGGAGYVGSHCVRQLVREGHEVVIFDNLTGGHPEAVAVEVVRGDLTDRPAILHALSDRHFDAVMHFAGAIVVAESIVKPGLYYRNNVGGSINLLDAMVESGVRSLVFSSTSEIYGEAQSLPLAEDHPKEPSNPYGDSKWVVERMLRRYDAAHGLRSVSLRYFNAAGAADDGSIGEDHRPESHLIPSALMGALGQKPFALTCSVVDTLDGTTIRDYVHVDDLASAHTLAVEALARGCPTDAFNVGIGMGYSTKQVIDAVQRVTGVAFEVTRGEARQGEPAARWAANQKIRGALGWAPRHDLDSIIASAWLWHKTHPHGFDSHA